MSDDLIKLLMAAGLNKQQAGSVTAETCAEVFMRDDGKALIAEAKRQVSEMRSMVIELQRKHFEEMTQLRNISSTLSGLAEAKENYGDVADEKARNVVALYAALLSMNEKTGASAEEAVKSASYVVYAYLGGQAKREITYNGDFEQ